MPQVTKKVTPGKKDHKHAIKSCQTVLYSSKTATEWLSSKLVDLPSIPRQNNGQKTPSFATQCFLITSKGSMKFFTCTEFNE